jgi:hypothetical protein
VVHPDPFTHPHWYDLSLGGHRCDLRTYLISDREEISAIRSNPERLLETPALVPLDEMGGEGHRPDDLFVFGFLLGIRTSNPADEERTLATGNPAFFMHLLPQEWSHPATWRPMEGLVLKSESDYSISVELGGLNGRREFVSTTLELLPRKREAIAPLFHSLCFIHTNRRPAARLGVHASIHKETILIRPHEWENLWIYGMDIFLAGWLTFEDFRRKGKVLNKGAHTLQFNQTRVKNLSLPLAELNPLAPLMNRVRNWEQEMQASRLPLQKG